MKAVGKTFFLFIALSFGILYPNSVWSRDCPDCSVQSGIRISGCDDISCAYCGDADESLSEYVCMRMRQNEDINDIEAYFNRCKEERGITEYKSFLNFLNRGQCTSLLNFTKKPDVNARDFGISQVKDYQFFKFYQTLIKKASDASKNSDYDQLKEVVAMMNTPNRNGETILDFMENYYTPDLRIIGITNQIERLHRVACMVGVVYRKHPSLNNECLSRRKSKYID